MKLNLNEERMKQLEEMHRIPLEMTIRNPEWVKKNEQTLKEIFPETWTHMHNLNGLQIGFQLKLYGVDWQSQEEFGQIMVYLEKIKIFLRDGYLVKRNPRSIFQ